MIATVILSTIIPCPQSLKRNPSYRKHDSSSCHRSQSSTGSIQLSLSSQVIWCNITDRDTAKKNHFNNNFNTMYRLLPTAKVALEYPMLLLIKGRYNKIETYNCIKYFYS